MAEHTKRPLNELERRFAEEHHNLIYRYMRLHRLDPEEWYDILNMRGYTILSLSRYSLEHLIMQEVTTLEIWTD